MPLFRLTDEEDMAGLHSLPVWESLYDQGSIVHRFAHTRQLKVWAKRILAYDSENERRGRIRKRRRRPLHKLSEVKQERRLDLILAQRLSAAVVRHHKATQQHRDHSNNHSLRKPA